MDSISVIVPIYNTEALLDRCIESIVNQTYTNLQIVLVNDGSTDNSMSVCIEWCKKDHRIVVVNKRNGGQASARNFGLNLAIGDWIGFIDSNDMIEYNYYEQLLSCAQKANADVSVCPILSKKADGTIFDPYKTDFVFSSQYQSIDFLDLLYFNDKSNGYVISSVNKLFRRKIWCDSVTLRYKEERIYEDDEIVSKIYVNRFTVALTMNTAYYYIMNPSSTTNSPYNVVKWVSLQSYYERIIVFEQINEGLYRNAVIMFLNLYIEHYYKMLSLQIPVDQMRELFLDALKRYKKTHTFGKTTIRYDLFRISPKMYSVVCKRIG